MVWAILSQFWRWRYHHGSVALVYGSLSERRTDILKLESCNLYLRGRFCLNSLTGLHRLLVHGRSRN